MCLHWSDRDVLNQYAVYILEISKTSSKVRTLRQDSPWLAVGDLFGTPPGDPSRWKQSALQCLQPALRKAAVPGQLEEQAGLANRLRSHGLALKKAFVTIHSEHSSHYPQHKPKNHCWLTAIPIRIVTDWYSKQHKMGRRR